MADETTRVETFPEGVFGHTLREVERAVPLDAPPPWPANAQLAVVGKATPRLDGAAKVTGRARYTADVRLPGMLHARMVRSTVPHARVLKVDTSAAELHPGVRAVHVLDRLLGGAVLRDRATELPSSYPVVRYVGQPIAAVVALTPADAEEAARLVKVELEPLPFVVDPDEAARPDAPVVFPGAADQAGTAGGGGGPAGVPQTGNVRGPLRRSQGDVEAGLAAADVVVDRVYRTRVQTHAPMETHGVVAEWSADGLTVWASTQGTLSVRDELATALGLPRARVRVITEFMGGGFGAKFGAGNYGLVAALLARKAGAPVRLMLDRAEEHLAGGNRPDAVMRLRLGAKKDGALTALHLVSHGTGGTGTGAGAAGPAQNMYPTPALLTEEHDVFTNAGPAAAFRAPGHPQGCFALEQAVDELAERLGKDPLALRDTIDVDGPTMIDSAVRKLERQVGAERFGWARRRAPGADQGPIKRGVGFAQSVWYRLTNFDSACEVRVWKDGLVEVRSAVQDIGGGIRTALAQVVAEELGLTARDVIVRIGDTDHPPGPGSGGSMTTGSITPAARDAAHRVRRHVVEAAARALQVAPAEVELGRGALSVRGDPARAVTFAQACGGLRTEPCAERAARQEEYGAPDQGGGRRRMGVESLGGAQFVEVEVDTETGAVRVVRVVAVHDCGRPINPLALESQVNGGVLQGISYALFEERVLDRGSGRMLNANLEQYKLLGARETPEIEVVLLEDYHGRSSTDAAGIGEPATIPTAAAIANAFYNATGVRMLELPMTPARVLAALDRARLAGGGR